MLIIFDLDGTLIDSGRDLAISMNATRQHFGLPPVDPELIYSYVGNGAAMLVRRVMAGAIPNSALDDALKFFLQYYRTHALEHTRLYPGVREVVVELSDARHTLTVLTNKPVRISFDIVAALGLATRFERVYGGDSFSAKKPDPVGVTTLIEDTRATAEFTLLVGDSSVDVQTARNAGVRSCGVGWGFQPESFQEYPPDVLIQEPRELIGVVAEAAAAR